MNIKDMTEQQRLEQIFIPGCVNRVTHAMKENQLYDAEIWSNRLVRHITRLRAIHGEHPAG